MIGRSWKFWLIGAVVAAALLTGASEANAWWCGYGCYQPANCYASCYTPCYTTSCDPCGGGWYAGVRPGPVRRLVFGPYRWYWSPYYSTPISYAVSYNACCTQTGLSVTTPAATTPTPAIRPPVEPPVTYAPPEDTPATEPADVLRDLPGTLPGDTLPDLNPLPDAGLEPAPIVPEPAPIVIPEARTPLSSVPTLENSGLLTIWVPYDAKLTINGLVTQSKGSQRRYVSYGLKPGYNYKYEIRAEVVRDGKRIESVRKVILTASDRKSVAFGFNPEMVEGLVAN